MVTVEAKVNTSDIEMDDIKLDEIYVDAEVEEDDVLREMDNDDIISYLENQGYIITDVNDFTISSINDHVTGTEVASKIRESMRDLDKNFMRELLTGLLGCSISTDADTIMNELKNKI